MQITAELIESLLWEPEGTALDFKSQQYPFAGGTDDQKGELLKDILALANAFRREDAFILVGVKEVKGTRAEIVGVTNQLEDSHIQQFVSGNVQRPLLFSYRAMVFQGKPIGVVHIPKQKRPFYCRRDYGGLKKGAVYVRRGSATEIAQPDEIAAMGSDQFAIQTAEPVLAFSLFERSTGTLIGNSMRIASLALTAPDHDEIPDYRSNTGIGQFEIDIGRANPDYYRELAEFTCIINLAKPVSFAVTNSGDVTAHDVRLVFEIDNADGRLYLCEGADMPEPPVAERGPADFIRGARFAGVDPGSNISISKVGNVWKVECSFGKIQPKDTVRLADDLFIGSVEDKSLGVAMRMFADNLSHPIAAECSLTFDVEYRSVSLEDIKRLEYARFLTTPRGKRFLEESKSNTRKKGGG